MLKTIKNSLKTNQTVFGIVCAVLSALAFSHYFPTTSSVFLLLIAVLTAISCIYVCKNTPKQYKPQAILSVFLSLFVSIGRLIQLHGDGYENFLNHDIPMNLISMAGLWLFFFFITSAAFVLIDRTTPAAGDRLIKMSYWKVFLICWAIIFICYIPYLLAFYPGVVSNDSYNQIEQVLGLRAYSNAHPAAHTFLIWICFKIGHLFSFGNNTCVAIYSISQMLFMSAVFSYTATYILRRRAPKWVFIATVGFFALFPMNGFFAITMWKDFVFSCFLLLLIICLLEIVRTKGRWLASVWHCIGISVLFIAIGIFRSNGVIVLGITALAMLIFLRNKKLRFILLAGGSFVVVMLYQSVFLSSLGVLQTSTTEALGIPMNQICRVAATGKELNEEQQQLIENLVGTDVKDVYKPYGYDPIKFNPKYHQKALDEHVDDYMKLWADLLIRYPDVYVESYFCQTLGYWYPDMQNEITDAYVHENPSGIYELNLVPALRDFLFNYAKPENFFNNPFLWCFNNMAYYVWAVGFLIAYCFYKRKGILLLAWMPLVATWLSIMISAPVNHVSRYIYIFFIALPLVVVESIYNISDYEVDQKNAKKITDKV
ncbi:DUF6020 family protein [Candidatus Soleaferrea massiliensis]|uniref:DUF6020 family protein n=1 Tax=Candidatus Soleaferrea massiliensis TaxID=1470354 RepID=UPI00058C9980|nr:DUF6020 family protein [Candidatus Soleaferrea massiliensis]